MELMMLAKTLVLVGIFTFLASLLPTLAQSTNGLIADYRFDGRITNRTGLPTPGLATQAAVFGPNRAGATNQALDLQGRDFIGSTSVDYLKNRRSWTWSAWIRPRVLTTTAPAAIYSEGNDGISGLIGEYQGGIIVSVWSESYPGSWGTLQSPALLKTNEWTHVAVVLRVPDGAISGTAVLFKDGLPVATGPMPYLKVSDSRANIHQFALGMNVGAFYGGQSGSPYAYRGGLESLKIFNRALADQEILGLAGKTQALFIQPAVELLFATETGLRYRLQWSEDLTGWTDHGDVIVGTGETYSTFASAKDKTHRYWRLVFAP
jgi:hypothetical protein